MVRCLVEALDWDMNEEIRSHEDTKKFYVEQWRTMDIMGAPIKFKLNKKDYEVFFEKVLLGDNDFIQENDAMRFIS